MANSAVRDLADSLKDLRYSVAAIVQANGNVRGTGFFIRADGYLLTCHHVVRHPQRGLKIKVYDEPDLLDAVVIASDPSLDVAILKIERLECQTLPVCGEWRVGLPVATHGFSIDTPIREFPDGVPARFEIDGTTTVVSQNGHGNDAMTLRGGHANRGLSGGPILSQETGHVLGMLRYRHDASQAAFATPVDYLAGLFPVVEEFWSRVAPQSDWGHLPYFLDRTSQGPLLLSETRKRINGEDNSPLFAIVHGAEDACPDALIDIFKDDCLPMIMNGGTEFDWQPGFQVEDRHQFPRHEWSILPWPREDEQKTVATLNERLVRDLLSLQPNPDRSWEEVTLETFIATSEQPILVRATIDSDLWSRSDARLLADWIAYWHRLQNLRPGHLVGVFFVIYYRGNATSFFSRLLSPIATIKRSLAKIESGSVILPELTQIRKLDGEDWVRALAARKKWRSATQAVIDDVTELFGQEAEKPLNQLAQGLKGVLNAHTRT